MSKYSDKVGNLMETVKTSVMSLQNTEEWEKFLKFQSKFHNYSLNNTLLIMAQCPEASYVAGYKKWKTLGRQVRRGEKALGIFGISYKKVEDEDGEEKKKYYFPILNVFDISQTDPIEGAETPWDIDLKGTGGEEIFEVLSKKLKSDNWDISFDSMMGKASGMTDMNGHHVHLNTRNEPLQNMKTLIHEYAHIILHKDKDDYQGHRGLYETEAESVAYVVAGALGIDVSSYSITYIAGWSRFDEKTLEASAKNVVRASNQILKLFEDKEVK